MALHSGRKDRLRGTFDLTPCDQAFRPSTLPANPAALAAGKGIRRIARELQAGVGTVLRLKAEMAAARPFDGVSAVA